MTPSERSSVSPVLRVSVVGATDVGRMRSHNEDAFLISNLGSGRRAPSGDREEIQTNTGRPLLLAVSDGVGSGPAGELASRLTLEALGRTLPPTAGKWGPALRRAVEAANHAVWDAASQRTEFRGMAATLTAVCVHRRTAHIVEVGDSRAYLIRGGMIRLLTRDQSYVQALIDAGMLTPEQAERSSLRNVILAAIGSERDVTVDLGTVELEPGDALVLCSDGLSNELDAPQIRASVVSSATPYVACARLIEAANGHGGRDNITAVVASFAV